MVAAFRKFDQNFTNINRSGVLLSSNDLSRISNESLDRSIILPNESEDEENSSISEDASTSHESFPTKAPIEECQNSTGQMAISSSFDTGSSFVSKRENSRRFFRKPSDECCIL
jgi:hypothetical protein